MKDYNRYSAEATRAFQEGEYLKARRLIIKILEAKLKFISNRDIEPLAKNEGFNAWVEDFSLEDALFHSNIDDSLLE